MSFAKTTPAELKAFSRMDLKNAFRIVPWSVQGRIRQVQGTIIEAFVPGARLGTIAEIEIAGREDRVIAEVCGFTKDGYSQLIPYSHLNGVAPGALVTPLSMLTQVRVGDYLKGRVVDAFLEPIDGHPLVLSGTSSMQDIERQPPSPLDRQRIHKSLALGVRAIDGLMTFGEGQRIGIMAGSGVGKSVLMGMVARNSAADINVIGLIGERGREVKEFIERDLGPEGLARSVIVTVTSDQSPLLRIRAAKVATAIAEYFSGQGKSVMLMLDSLTRVAMAQREIGNAIGEPPTTKGYTPSVFSLLPKILERTGPQRSGCGPISALYTVLVDGDDFNDPIADTTRSILDGHINLSRTLATRNHFPAIDISTSCSRVMNDVVSREHWRLAGELKGLLGTYQENIDLIQIGAYQRGTNRRLDEAMSLMPNIERYLQQDMNEISNADDALRQLNQVLLGMPLT